MTAGFLVVDKPSGISSNAVVSQVRKATGIRKAGHAGTLDPLATGVVVVAVGQVTRLLRFIQDQEKEYLATAVFGVATDTLDADGAVLSREPMNISESDVKGIAGRFVGTIQQVPPMVSALKHEGRRLYELARAGEVIERESRPVVIEELEVASVGPGPYPEVEFRVVCGKGTYVRSLADDMAAALGGRAHLRALRRIRIGGFTVEHAISVSALEEWRSALVSPSDALRRFPSVVVDFETGQAVRNGMRFVGGNLVETPEDTPIRVLDDEGELLAVYRRVGDQAMPEVVIPA